MSIKNYKVTFITKRMREACLQLSIFVCCMIIFLSQFMVGTNFERKQISFYFFITDYYPCFVNDHCPRDMCKVYQIPKCVAGLCRCIPLRCGRWVRWKILCARMILHLVPDLRKYPTALLEFSTSFHWVISFPHTKLYFLLKKFQQPCDYIFVL